MTAAVAAPAPEDDDVDVIEGVHCRCGRLAAVVLVADEDGTSCSVRCPCGSFSPVAPSGSDS